MQLSYDLHIHTALSPCGDEDMTPNNIVNMSILKGLDVIAITDHNICGNAKACMDAAEGTGLIVLPGLEVESCEAVHNLCIFEDIESAKEMERIVLESLPNIKNRPDIFGREIFLDRNDNECGEEDILLLNSSFLSIYDIKEKTEELGGVYIPAHIDREAYGILASLGIFPEDIGVKLLEVSQSAPDGFTEDFERQYGKGYAFITSSDAHYLENISERRHFLDACKKTPYKIVEKLRYLSKNGNV